VYHTYSDYARAAGVSLGHVPVARATRLIATVTTPSHASVSPYFETSRTDTASTVDSSDGDAGIKQT